MCVTHTHTHVCNYIFFSVSFYWVWVWLSLAVVSVNPQFLPLFPPSYHLYIPSTSLYCLIIFHMVFLLDVFLHLAVFHFFEIRSSALFLRCPNHHPWRLPISPNFFLTFTFCICSLLCVYIYIWYDLLIWWGNIQNNSKYKVKLAYTNNKVLH